MEEQILKVSAGADGREPVPAILSEPTQADRVVAIHNDYRLERLPRRDRSRRTHEFHVLRDFAAWLRRHAEPEEAEVLVCETEAKALLHAEDANTDVVSCRMVPHPSFGAWHGMLGKALGQKAFHQHVRAYRETLPGASELLGALAQIKVVDGGTMQSHVDELGYFTLVGGDRTKNVSARIPPEITAVVPIFDRVTNELGAEHVYELALLVSLDADAMTFTLTCPQLPVVLLRALSDAVAYLGRELGEGFLVGAGRLRAESVSDERREV